MSTKTGEIVQSSVTRGDLADAARNAATNCLSASEGDVATLVTDEESRDGMAAIARALEDLGAKVQIFVIEELGRRPLVRFPREVMESLERSQVSVYWAIPLPGELKSRLQILEASSTLKLRHAHLIGLQLDHFVEGMRVDYRKIAALQERIVERLRKASSIRVTTRGGSDLTAPLSADTNWVSMSGIIKPGVWQNLPSGQMMFVPETASGKYVADAALGDWFGTKYQELPTYPLTVDIEEGRAIECRSPNQKLAREFSLYVRSNPNADRVGEMSIGTNLGLQSFTGKAVIDENVTG